MSLKDNVLSARDRKVEPVEMAEWGLTVYVRVFSGTERREFEKWCMKNKGTLGDSELFLRIAFETLSDENGSRLFTTDDDLALLGTKSALAIRHIADVADRLNGLSPESLAELKKKWRTTPSSNGGSELQGTLAVA